MYTNPPARAARQGSRDTFDLDARTEATDESMFLSLDHYNNRDTDHYTAFDGRLQSADTNLVRQVHQASHNCTTSATSNNLNVLQFDEDDHISTSMLHFLTEDDINDVMIRRCMMEDRKPAFPEELVHELYRICLLTKPADEGGVTDPEFWEPVRSFLLSDCNLVKCAAGIRSPAGLTPFHQICRHSPPADIVELFISCVSIDVVRDVDHAGMLPLHYASIHETSLEVIEILITLYPESLTMQNKDGATPLHYAVANIRCSNQVIARLCVEGAAAVADDRGMLPVHYGTVIKAFYRAETLKNLMDAYIGGFSTTDRKGRVPIRWLAKTCDLTETLDLLIRAISLDPALAKGDLGLSLLTILGECADKVGPSNNIQAFLALLLDHNPEPSARFLAVVKSLPRWLHAGNGPQKKWKLVRWPLIWSRFRCG